MKSYPYASDERDFSAMAMPQGDRRNGVAGPLVQIIERRRHCIDKVRMLTQAEAAALHFELGEALRAFDLAKQLAADVVAASCSAALGRQDTPRAATAPYPFRDHGTLADHGFLQGEA